MGLTFCLKQVDPSAPWASCGGCCGVLPGPSGLKPAHSHSCWESWLLISLHWITFWGFPSIKGVTLPKITSVWCRDKTLIPYSIQDNLNGHLSIRGPHGPLLQPHVWLLPLPSCPFLTCLQWCSWDCTLNTSCLLLFISESVSLGP